VVAYTYNIVLAPGGTPRGVVDVLNRAIATVMADRAFVDTLVKLGVDPVSSSSPDKAAAMLRTELAKWAPLIQALGVGGDAPTRSASPSR
jgi:tripartite-type tricarboxylate transporter receptor subunit TctC